MNHSFGRVIGIEVQVEAYVAVAVDLAGEILQELRGKVPAGWSDCSDMMNEVIREVTTTLCPDSKRLLGVGVGTGGLIDFRKGRDPVFGTPRRQVSGGFQRDRLGRAFMPLPHRE